MSDVIKSQTYRGVRDWSVSASRREGSDQVEVTFKLGKTCAGPKVSIPVSQWPELGADQQKRMLEAMGSRPEEDGYCQSVRLADEARRAVSEVLAASPKPDQASQPWEISCREYQLARARTVAGGVPILNARDGDKHERIVRYALLRGLQLSERVMRDYPHMNPEYLAGYVHHLRYFDNGSQVGFEGETYLLLNAYAEHDGTRYGSAWYLYTTKDLLLAPDPEDAKAYIADRSMHETVTMAEAWLGIRIVLEGAPADLPDIYPLDPRIWEVPAEGNQPIEAAASEQVQQLTLF
jgi:hypothetical protein